MLMQITNTKCKGATIANKYKYGKYKHVKMQIANKNNRKLVKMCGPQHFDTNLFF